MNAIKMAAACFMNFSLNSTLKLVFYFRPVLREVELWTVIFYMTFFTRFMRIISKTRGWR